MVTEQTVYGVAPVSDADPHAAAASLRRDFERHLRRTLVKDRYTATDRDRYYALALTVRDRLIERWIATQQIHHNKTSKASTICLWSS